MNEKFHWIEQELLHSFDAEGTNAHRLATIPDGWVERYGRDILISYRNDIACERLTTELYLWGRSMNFDFGRIFGRRLPKKNPERQAPELMFGDAEANLQTVVRERTLQFEVDFAAGYSVGLFIDQRENRRFVRDIRSKRMLNCFAYTCSFSVAAATVGAQTVSIDLSKKSLARGKANFALNSIQTTEHRFIADDVLSVLPRLARKEEKFDMIILDPPTFSRTNRGKTFQVEDDFEDLLMAALDVADRAGHILLSTNCTTLDSHGLEVMARYCLKARRRAGKFHREPTPPDFPERAMTARTLWMKLR